MATLEQILETAATSTGGFSNPLLIKKYLEAGGTLTNGRIPSRIALPGEEIRERKADTITVPSTITSDDLTPRAPFTPASFPAPEPPTIKFEETPKEKEATDLEPFIKDLRAQLSEKPQFEQLQREQAGIEAKTQVVESLSRQIRDIAKQQELVPLTIERQSIGRGRTEGGVFPLQMGLRRTLAYEGLILSSRLDAARGDLDIAERKVQTAVDTKFAPIEAQLREQEANYAFILNSPTTTRQEKQRALELETKRKKYEEESAAFKETQKTILKAVNDASAELSKRGAWNDAAKEDLSKAAKSETLFGALDILSPYLKETTKEVLDVASKVAEQKGTAEQIEKIRNARDGADATRIALEMGFVVTKPEKAPSLGTDFEQYEFFAKQRGEPVTQEGFLRYKAQLGAAGRKPKGGGFEQAEVIIRENPKKTDDELRVLLLRDTELNVSEVEALLKTREKIPLSLEEIKTEIISKLEGQKEIVTRKEAESLIENQLREDLKIKKEEELPAAFTKAIKEALSVVYGLTKGEKIKEKIKKFFIQ